ncbi:MAG: adenosylcobinamide-GDP ribazoletransferase [Acidibacillus sp.]|uniref:Adenosylcobinamide-GDP ribazoletransferase n=1 Tax=Sulfoacidibacillus ferrooxidans TaxID=2005001 RepID=A0A9X2ACW5_9BACL|nr:adenosylcobinamide-GDP ribazoletransferase [Sulfoacidibacillus ferrooxidans]MCI0182770.1 Adenosylcobinamide-GDP ribazoletransferase [Sulfoacidibacillus ferrooxidans]MCY0892559.1 adenosylcobinamide-GDP ribazoletransferase [Acidibacillus sp.]
MLDAFYRQAKAFVLAVQFLTRFPAPRIADVDEEDVNRSYAYYPLVGVMLGATYALFALIIHILYASSLLMAVLLVAVQLYFTGGLHMDGLMDTADGMLSYRSREEVLTIMKDSRVGAMGVIVFAVSFLLRIAVYDSLPLYKLVALLFVTPVASRSVLLVLFRFTRPARTRGLGQHAIGKTRLATLVWANSIAILLVALLLKEIGIMAMIVGILVVIRLIRSCNRRLGGMTGDTFGAAVEILEGVVALVFAMRTF